MTARKLYISVLISLFLLSVIVRLDNLTQHMGKHHEFITGHVLTANTNFENDGLFALHFSPAYTFNNKADRLVPKYFIHDDNNVQYYVSYPPFSFLAAYFWQIPFGGPSVAAIRLFSLCIHFCCALLVISLLNALFKKKLSDGFYLPSLVGYIVYLFAPGNLWFHSNVYFADTLVQLFVLSAFYVLVKFSKGEYSTKKSLILFFVIFFLGVYTEWLMFFLSIAFGVFMLLKARKDKSYWKPLLALSSGVVLSLALTFFQYSSIAGIDKLLEEETSKIEQRSGMVKDAAEYNRSYYEFDSFLSIDEHYSLNYGWVRLMFVLCLFFLFLLLLNRKKRADIFARNMLLGEVLLLLVLGILMHHFIFFNFTSVHDFSTLKSSTLFSIFIAFSYHELMIFITDRKPQFVESAKKILAALLFILSCLSVQEYYSVNSNENRNVDQFNLGEIIKQKVKEDELVATVFYVSPEMMFYSKRNVKSFPSLEEFSSYVNSIHFDKLVFFGKKDDNTYLFTRMKNGAVVEEREIPMKR
ncbi:MAG: ArnT family glycosyltransferase [Flavobacteriales bacterium]